MGKQILIIQGGGRPKGNTAQLVAALTQGAQSAGHAVEMVSLLKNEVKGCLGCNACRYRKPCIQKDAFNDLVPKIKAADCIVFASPLYFRTVSARIKAFIERFYCIAAETSTARPRPAKPGIWNGPMPLGGICTLPNLHKRIGRTPHGTSNDSIRARERYSPDPAFHPGTGRIRKYAGRCGGN